MKATIQESVIPRLIPSIKKVNVRAFLIEWYWVFTGRLPQDKCSSNEVQTQELYRILLDLFPEECSISQRTGHKILNPKETDRGGLSLEFTKAYCAALDILLVEHIRVKGTPSQRVRYNQKVRGAFTL